MFIDKNQKNQTKMTDNTMPQPMVQMEVKLRTEELLTSLKYGDLTTTEILAEVEALNDFVTLLK